MPLTASQLVQELSTVLDPSLAQSVVENYAEMHQRFLAGDWQPAELDGGRLCEAIARCLHQMDTGLVTHSQLPGKIIEKLENDTLTHTIKTKDRHHIAKVIATVYKFRSDRGIAHISQHYNANQMDAMFILHAGKWLFSEFLRLAWNQDRDVIAEKISQIVQLEHSLIHDLDGKPMVLSSKATARDEILLLLNHAPSNRLKRSDLRETITAHTSGNINVAISRLLKAREIREADADELSLTPIGQHKILNEIIPKLGKR